MVPWLLIAILVMLVLLALVAWKSKNKKPTDYYSFFVMGIIWTAIGIPMDNYALSAMGVVFLIVGLVHKDEWKKNRSRWDQLSEKEKKRKLILIALAGLLVFVGLVLYWMQR